MTRVIDGAIEGVAISYTILTTLNVNRCKVFGNPPCLLINVSSKSSCLCLQVPSCLITNLQIKHIYLQNCMVFGLLHDSLLKISYIGWMPPCTICLWILFLQVINVHV